MDQMVTMKSVVDGPSKTGPVKTDVSWSGELQVKIYSSHANSAEIKGNTYQVKIANKIH
ncbi:protein of unknown function [Candidatus Nitrosotalea okcheonensis]|uniref:Uncharacterized protein n=1 Tax=Candidatus Nitrosotalea okcheonensis TaxID=1903276 RepID=A0A2H1FIK0_9ARCH|nr:protein of unknown function [Candidatus Nitrosotalea okcheonensis]